MPEPFDMGLVGRGARNRRTPYYEATQRYGPKGFTVYNHMYFPIRFDTFENEYQTLLNDVTLWDVAVERCLEISGSDGFRFAQLMTPRDLSKCAVGQAKYVLICDSDGGIINDPVLTRMDENRFWFALASSDALLFARGLKNAYPELDVTIREADVAPLQVQGPKSKDLMAKLLGEGILDLKYYWWTNAEIAGVPVVVTRTGWTSEVGYEVYTTDTSRGNDVYEAIMKAGEEFKIKPTGPSDIRRIEGAIFNWGADMTYEHNAFEQGHPGTGRGATPQRRRAGRRSLPRPQQREVARLLGRRAGGQGHVGDLLTPPGEEHRVLLAPDGALRRGNDRQRRDRVGGALGDRGGDALRGSEQADPGLLRAEAPFSRRGREGRRGGVALGVRFER
jgi:glycine cleavage system aminomethyltransferase T